MRSSSTHHHNPAEGTFRRRLISAIVLPIALMAVYAGSLAWQVNNLLSATAWVDHTDRVIAGANALEKLLLERETGERGYLLTGRPELLVPYQRASASYDTSWNALRTLVSDNPSQVAKLDVIGNLADRWETDAEKQLRRRDKGEDYLTPLQGGNGKDLMDAVRAQLSEFVHTEERLRDQRSATAQSAARWALTLGTGAALGVGTVLSYATRRHLIAVATDYDRALREREAANSAVQEMNRTLEAKVMDRTAQLEEANAELEAFSYSVSHDLRAPLRAMQGFSRALEEDYGETLDHTAHDYIGRISGAAERMDTLINDLLAYSRLSRTDLLLHPVSLESVFRDALQQSGVENTADVVVEGCLPAVMGARPVLVQVFANLLGNAAKFVREGVQPQITVFAEPHDGKARIWVRDNGIGIAPEYHERIFRVFERLHGQESYPGTGIGLAIVKKGVERMGGEVGVEAIEGGGSAFWVELPLAAESRGKR